MWFIFGLDKVQRPLSDACTAHCFDCQRHSTWTVWSDAEWFTLATLRLFRFSHQHLLHCDGCGTTLTLLGSELEAIERELQRVPSINGSAIHAQLTLRIEATQLANKTPVQVRFIRESMKARAEYHARMQAREFRDC